MSPFRRIPGQKPLIWGHRGVRGLAPENTLTSFRRALDDGADGLELDVRACRSGELVVLHDATLARTTGDRDYRAAVDLDADTITLVDVGGDHVPRLRDVLALVRARGCLLNVEMKHDVPDRGRVVRAIARELRGFPRDRVLVSCFHPAMLTLLGALDRTIARAFLTHEGQRRYRPWAVARALGTPLVHPERTLVTARDVAAAHARGAVVNAWTVNDEAEARRLADLGVDGLITDDPKRIRAALG